MPTPNQASKNFLKQNDMIDNSSNFYYKTLQTIYDISSLNVRFIPISQTPNSTRYTNNFENFSSHFQDAKGHIDHPNLNFIRVGL